MVEFARKHSSAELIAEKVETAEQYELAAKHGIKLFQGYWFATPVLVTGQTLRPAQANIIQLINLVRQQAETEPRSRRCSSGTRRCRSTCCASSTRPVSA